MQVEDWLITAIPRHERLSVTVASLLENIIRTNKIEYLNVTSRTKTLDGAIEKIQRKSYGTPRDQLTDLSGIRVVTYLETHVAQISKLVRELFQVDEANSLDRTDQLGEDKLGYRSTHFVCSLGNERGGLPEYAELGDLKFEIQLRTVLQHAWAELAHDRSFKFGAALPSKIQRKMNLYSGMLELVDAAFDEIAGEIDDYKHSIEKKTTSQIFESEIDSISLSRFVSDLSKQLKIPYQDNTDEKILLELREFGLRKIGDIEALVTAEFREAISATKERTTSYGLLRDLMMFQDLDRYFGLGRKFSGIGDSTIKFLEVKYPKKKIESWLDKLQIQILGNLARRRRLLKPVSE